MIEMKSMVKKRTLGTIAKSDSVLHKNLVKGNP